MPDYQTITLKRRPGVATLTLNRPAKLNALNQQMVQEIGAVCDELRGDKTTLVLVITGAEAKAFAAGADIGEFSTINSAAAGEAFALRGQAVFSKLAALDQVVIAAINGYALGGGCELALACDLRIAAESATFGQPEISLGLIPGYGGTQRLTRLVGRGQAKRLMLTGDRLTAQQAYDLGLVEQVVPAAELMSTVDALADRLAGQPPIALAQIKHAVDEGADLPLAAALAVEAAAFGRAANSEDRLEGTAAFLAKRKPSWRGR